MEKSSQDIMEQIRRLGSQAKDYAGQGKDAIGKWYGGISPEAKKTLMRGLAGAGVAGGGVAALRALTPRDEESTIGSHVIQPALLAAILGGGAAAGLPASMKMLKGDIRLKEETKPGLPSRAVDSLVDPMVSNPATTAGGVIGAAKAPRLAKLIKNYTGGKFKPSTGKAALMGIPAGLLLGAVADRYLKGKM